MKEFHISGVDLKLLQIFEAVYEAGSVTGASARLELSQPLISHALDRLRSAFNDPLFVRSGRSIAPTDRAQELAPAVSKIIEQMLSLAEPGTLDTRELSTVFTLSANDFERRLIAPTVLREMLEVAPGASLRLVNSDTSVADALRSRRCDVVVTPVRPPDGHDFYSEPLFDDTFVCFFDRTVLSARTVRASYLSLPHAIVSFSGDRTTDIDPILREAGKSRSVRLIAPSFESLAGLMANTNLVTTLPSRLAGSVLAHFGRVEFPYRSPTLRFQMIWHKTTHNSARYRWFRSLIRRPFE